MKKRFLTTGKKNSPFPFYVILFLSLTVSVQVFAQKRIQPTPVDKNTVASLSKVFNKYDLFSVNTSEIKSFANSKGFTEYDFDFQGYPTFPVSIYENDLVSKDYKAFAGDDNGKRLLPTLEANTYSGSIRGDANSAVYLTLADNLVYGLIKKDSKIYFIEPLRYFEKNADASVYVLYEAADVVPHSGKTCGVTEAQEHLVQEQNRGGDNTSSAVVGPCMAVEVAISSDYSMTQRYGLIETQLHIIAVMNTMPVFYNNAQIGAGWLRFHIVGQYLSAAIAADPYLPAYTGIDADIMLSSFRTWGQAGNFGFTYDLAQVWTAKDIGSETFAGSGVYSYGTIGLAYIGGTCNSSRYMLLEDFSSELLSLGCCAAHEIGHNLGANHDAPGQFFIMAPTINNPVNTVFSPASLSAMSTYVSGPGGSCITSCATVPPMAAFAGTPTVMCPGSVTFTDNSQGASGRTWTFTGGDISTSTAVSPTVSFTTAGVKSVKLRITGSGFPSEVTKYFIVVAGGPAPVSRTSLTGNGTLPILQNFRLATINKIGPQGVNTEARYNDYACIYNTKLFPNTTYTVNFSAGLFSGSQHQTKLQLFIDYNGDNDFLDAGEEVANSGTTCYNSDLGVAGQFSFTTPASPVTDRFLRMRLIGIPCTLAFTNGQAIYSTSQVEDYAVYFPSACSSNITITGSSYVCPISQGDYQITGLDPSLTGTSIYWVGPPGSTILYGQGTSRAGIDFPVSFVSGTVKAYVEGCDGIISVKTFNVTKLPPVDEISGITDLCALPTPSSTTTYSVAPVFRANTYTWTVPPGVTLVSGQGTNSLQVSFAAGFSSGTITLAVTSTCGSGTITKSIAVQGTAITASAATGGTISSVGISYVCPNASKTYTISADPCYSITNVLVDGVSQGAISAYTFTNVTAAHTISAGFVFNTNSNHIIFASAGTGGSISSPASSAVACGSSKTYTITPAACYRVSDVWVDEVSVGAVNTYTFSNVLTDHTIHAFFVLNTYSITATAGANGSISPGGSVNCGSNASYTITPNACYSVANVIVDGISQGAISTYTFTNVTAPHSISAAFALSTYNITATAGTGGSITPGSSVNCGSNASYTITPGACYSIANVIVDGVSQGAISSYTFSNVTTTHSISATFALKTYSIVTIAGANGSITPGGLVNCGNNATYSIIPNACYSIANVIVDGVSQGAISTYTFTNVTAAHAISASFVLNTYNITATAGANGSITPGGLINCGSNTTYNIIPNACYSIANVIVDGVSQGAISTYTFTNVTDAHAISASFVLNTYNITATAGANGSITPATGSVNCGANATYTITPNACYSIADVVVDGVSQGAIGTYTFPNITANHTISATFVLNTYTITVTEAVNGSITPATGSVNCGANATYTITPNACYSIVDVVVDGVSQGAVGTYTFPNITANHTISATFVLNTYAITVTADANGSITPATGSVNCGASATYTITPNACYSIANVIVDGVSQGAVETYTFTNVTANHMISAIFVLNTYMITVTAGANGSVTPGTGSVNCGANATYTITANDGYTISDVIVDGVSQGAVDTYTFTNVTSNHTINTTFVNNTSFTINASAGANGSISPNGVTVVSSGGNQSYTITPIACYHVADVLVDGVSVGAVTSYTFTNVTANHTISVSFAVNAALSISVSGPVNVCQYIGTADQVTYTATAAGATGFTWVIPATNVTIISGQGTANLTVSFQNGFATQANKQLRVTALSPCGNSPLFVYYLAVQIPSTPQQIVGQTNVCSVIGTAATLTYTIPPIPGASSYNWLAQAGTTTITHPNGLGANDTIVNVSFSAGFTSSPIIVSASNLGCGTSGVRSLALIKTNPPQPGLISGPTNACAYMAPGGTTASYSIVAVSAATSYTWTVPVGAIGLTGQGTTSISFTYPNGFVSGSISVTATNGCGTSVARTLSITKLAPATPGVIDVIQVASCPGRIYSYTLTGMPANATSVQWAVPAGGTITSGHGTSSITVSYTGAAVNGSVTAQAFNNCGSSTIRGTSVKLGTCQSERSITTKGSKVPATTALAESMQVTLFPNPTVSDFKLQVVTAGKETIRVRILDMQGRELKNLVVSALQTTNIGADLGAGAYIMEVKQGNSVKTVKLIKF
ncbi:MAG: zinc-dependent metalloprotease family protein [Ferruginibacter sp.]